MNKNIKIKRLEFINFNLKKIYNLSRQMNIEIFIVGGFIRDFLSGDVSLDIDFMTDKDTEKFAKQFADLIRGAFVVLDEEQKSYRIVKKYKNNEIFSFDFTERRADDFYGDLQKRDFTINALAIPLNINAGFSFDNFSIDFVIDKTNGIKDLKNKVVRAINSFVFDDDSLRLLRAFRLAAKYDFSIDEKTKRLIRQKSYLIKKSSSERIHDELLKFFSYRNKNIFEYVINMDKNGLLGNIFNEINFMKQQNDYYYHKFGLWGHSLEVLFCFEFVLDNLQKIFSAKSQLNQKIKNLFLDYIAKDDNFNLAKLRLLCLFHDIGKPDCFSNIDEKIHFFKHDEVSSKYIKKMLKNLKFSNKEIDFIADGAAYHMQAGNLAKQTEITDRACFRFFKRTGELGVGLLLFTFADWLASIRGVKGFGFDDGIKTSEFRYKDFVRCKKAIVKILDWHIRELEKPVIARFIDGNDVMQKFNLQPSKIIGEILDSLEEVQGIGIVKDKNEAYLFVEKYLEKRRQQKL